MLRRALSSPRDTEFWRRILTGGLLVFGATLAGRLAGFIRELVLAAKLGVTPETDIAVVVFTFPDLLVGFLIAGAASTVLIPEFERLRAHSPGAERRLAIETSWVSVAAAAVVVAVTVVLAPTLVAILSPGFSPDVAARAVSEVRVAALAFPALALTAVLRAYLHHRQRFLLPSAGAVPYNVIIAAVLMIAVGPEDLRPLSLAVVAGASVIAAMHVLGSLRWSERGALPSGGSTGRLITGVLARRYAQALLAGTAIALLPFVARAAASTAGDGGVATFNFAMRLTELPNGTILAAISLPLFPAISRVMESGDHERAASLARKGAALILGGGIIVAGIVAAPSHLWADLVYLRGAVNAEDTAAIGDVTRVMALALPAQGIVPYVIYLFAAHRDFRRPLIVTLAGLTLFALAAFEVAPRGVEGIAFAFVGFYWLLATVLVVMLARIHRMPLISIRL